MNSRLVPSTNLVLVNFGLDIRYFTVATLLRVFENLWNVLQEWQLRPPDIMS